MQRAVEERVESEHSAEAYEPLHARPLPERRDGEREHEEDERQSSRRSRHEVERVRADLTAPPVPTQKRQRHEGVDEDHQLVEFNVLHKNNDECGMMNDELKAGFGCWVLGAGEDNPEPNT